MDYMYIYCHAETFALNAAMRFIHIAAAVLKSRDVMISDKSVVRVKRNESSASRSANEARSASAFRRRRLANSQRRSSSSTMDMPCNP